MREIVLDTETTGLDPNDGHRVVEIGAVELYNHLPTGRTYHQYLDPQRPMPREAFAIHGLDDDFLRGKSKFRDQAAAFLAFIGAAPLIIHNAAFDMKFLNHELATAGLPGLPMTRAIDTVAIARRKYPGSPASLDALCRRFHVDNSGREKHGALLDSELLAEVYLELIGGRQPGLELAQDARANGDGRAGQDVWRPVPRPDLLAPRITATERDAHAALIAQIGPGAIWLKRR